MERLAGRVILLSGWSRWVVALLAGALLDLAQAPYDFFAVGFVSFPVLVWLLDGASARAGAGRIRRFLPAFAVGWWFGLGYFLGGIWWIGVAFLVDGGDYAWLMPTAVIAVPMVLAVYYGLACVLARFAWSDGVGRIAALAASLALFEWLRGWVLTGFPWNPLGFAAMPMPLLMQSVSVVGMVGMNALAVFVFAMPSLLAARRHRRTGLVLALLLCAAHAGFGAYRLNVPPESGEKTLAVRIVQPDVPMSLKWDPTEADRVFDGLLKASAAPPAAGTAKPELILWPETAVPFLLTERPDALSALGGMIADGQLLLAGAVRTEGADGSGGPYTNAVVAIDARGQIVDAVDKVHLVPGGEYLPFADFLHRIGIDQFVAGPMTFAAGAARHAITLPNGMKAVPFICFEAIFPSEVDEAAAQADFLVIVTNDTWFGDTPGPYQHFRQAQIRAVETGLPVVRAANSGISGVIDDRGRVVSALALGAKGTIDAVISTRTPSNPLTLTKSIAGWSIFGFLCFFSITMTLRRNRRAN